MKIVEVVWRYRNDFRSNNQCEHCGHIERDCYGYADHYFQSQVLPSFHCNECGKNSYGDVKQEAVH